MSEQQPETPSSDPQEQIMIVGPDGQPVAMVPASALGQVAASSETDVDTSDDGETSITEMVQQPAKVMRIGTMIKQLLEEVKAAPLDEASRVRLKEIHASSIKELEEGLAPELVEELHRLSLPFAEGATPSESELRIAQAQLVGWLEGLFHGIQTALFAQQMAAKMQLEQQGRGGRPALPQGLPQAVPGVAPGGTGQYL